MRILLHSHFPAGHAYPMQAVAEALVSKGHEVAWLTSADNDRRVLASGASFIATSALSAIDTPLAKAWATGLFDGNQRRIAERMRAQIADYRSALASFRADVLLVDVLPHGARALYELGEIPSYASLGVIPLYTSGADAPLVFSGGMPTVSWAGTLANGLKQQYSHWVGFEMQLRPLLNEQRAAVGLGPLPPGETLESSCYSPILHIQASSPRLEFHQTSKQPGQNTVFVGPLVMPAKDVSPEQLPPWWQQVVDHPRVIGITQGTLAMQPTALIIPAIRALADDPDNLLVVVSSYAESLRALDNLPKHVLIADFLPYHLLLPQLRLFITNGGYGSVTQALVHNVPLICAGQSEDKKDTAARVAWCGAGIDLKTDTPSIDQIRDATSRILSSESYSLKAAKVGSELRSLGGANAACDALESLVQNEKRVVEEAV